MIFIYVAPDTMPPTKRQIITSLAVIGSLSGCLENLPPSNTKIDYRIAFAIESSESIIQNGLSKNADEDKYNAYLFSDKNQVDRIQRDKFSDKYKSVKSYFDEANYGAGDFWFVFERRLPSSWNVETGGGNVSDSTLHQTVEIYTEDQADSSLEFHTLFVGYRTVNGNPPTSVDVKQDIKESPF